MRLRTTESVFLITERSEPWALGQSIRPASQAGMIGRDLRSMLFSFTLVTKLIFIFFKLSVVRSFFLFFFLFHIIYTGERDPNII